MAVYNRRPIHLNRSKALYQLFRPTVLKQHLHLSLTGKGKYKLCLALSISASLFLSLSHTLTRAHIQCDKCTSVTHNAIPVAIVRGSADQTLHRALLQIQAATLVALLYSGVFFQEDNRQTVVTKVIML